MIEGYSIPIHRSLTEPLFMAGAPRGIAIINGTIAAAIGLGMIFSQFLAGAFRNPSASAQNQPTMLLAFALTEFTGLLGFVIAILILLNVL